MTTTLWSARVRSSHHRSCYNQTGRCAYEQFHGTESQWRDPETPEPQKQPDEPEQGFPPFFGRRAKSLRRPLRPKPPIIQNPYNQNPYGQNPLRKLSKRRSEPRKNLPEVRKRRHPVNNTCPECGYVFPPSTVRLTAEAPKNSTLRSGHL